MVEPVRAAVYARISRDVTGEGLGVERQLSDCRRIVRDRGWVLAGEYVDNDVSAFAGKRRPEYERMLGDIEAGLLDAVVVYNTDRLTRRPIELEQFTAVCEAAGVRQLVAVTGDINLGNDDGMFMARVLAAVAAKESGRKSERLKRKALELAEAGKPNGGPRPFGYGPDRVSVVESEAAIVRELATRYLAGESSASLVAWLEASGVRGTTGRPWYTSTLRNLLVSPRIAGLRVHQGQVVGPAAWPAIITEAQHRQLVARFSARTPSSKRTPRRYLLSGLLRCGKCGNRLYSSARDGIRRYICASGPEHGGCGRLRVVADPVEEWLAEAVLLRIDSPAMSDYLTGRTAEDDAHAGLLAELEADQAQMRELATMWADRVISAQEWKIAREPIEARIQTTNRHLSRLAGTSALDGLTGHGNELRTRWEGLNLTRQAAIVSAVLDYATITPATGGRPRDFDSARIVPTWRV